MQNLNLKAEPRDLKSKGNLRSIREQGWVPGIVYGKETGNKSIKINVKEFRELLAHGGRNHLFQLILGDNKEKHNVMIKEMSVEAIKGEILHVDFQQVSLKSKIHTKLPVRLIGDSIGVDKGGTLQHGIRELEIECLPTDIPDGFPVDISALEIGESLYVKDIQAVDNVTILADPESLVVTIVQPRLEVETNETAEVVDKPADAETNKAENGEQKEE